MRQDVFENRFKWILNLSVLLCFAASFSFSQENADNSALSNLANKKPEKKLTQAEKNNALSSLQDLLQKEFDSAPESGIATYRKFFDEEVKPYATFFVTEGFKSQGASFDPEHQDIQLDRDLLWKYLKFSSTVFATQDATKQPTLCIQSRAENGCPECDEVKNIMHAGLSERFARRGFSLRLGPAFANPLTSQSAIRGEKAFEEYVGRVAGMNVDASSRMSCEGELYFEVTQSDIESKTIQSFLELKDITGRKQRFSSQSQHTKTAEKFKSLNVEIRPIVAHQAVGLMGGKESQSSSPTLATRSAFKGPEAEGYIEVRGIDSYLKYQSFKQAFEEAYPQFPIEERVIRPGTIRFAIVGLGAGSGAISIDVLVGKFKSSSSLTSRGLRFEILKAVTASNTEAVILLKQG